ncbi:MAG: hypothetical protein QMD96_01380 [Anaerosomatales bacterium]|nr:hypothetical protein [Anaerosomatales bacterium]
MTTPEHGPDPLAARPRCPNRGALAVVAIAAVTVVLVLGGGSTRAACAVCHRGLGGAAGAAPGHARLSCYACHLGRGAADWPSFKARELFVMYPKAVAGAGLTYGPAPVERAACLRCHRRVADSVVEANGIRVDHRACAADRPCGDCHGASAHGSALRWSKQPVMEECVACHRAAGSPTECDSCHVEHTERERLAKGPWQITHGANWSKTHGMGTLQWCATCHPSGYCVRCHGVGLPHPADFGRTHGALAKAPKAACRSCHDEALCDGCHGVPMPHPEGFLVRHSSEASSSADPKCLSCHIQKDCQACHEMHVHPGSTEGTARLPRPEDVGLEGTP